MDYEIIEETVLKISRDQENIQERTIALEKKINMFLREKNSSNAIDELPAHLKITYEVLCENGEATATKIAEKTGRSRNQESMYCCQLEHIELIERRSIGRKQVFSIRSRT